MPPTGVSQWPDGQADRHVGQIQTHATVICLISNWGEGGALKSQMDPAKVQAPIQLCIQTGRCMQQYRGSRLQQVIDRPQ